MTRFPKLVGLLVCGCLSRAAPSSADPVLDWNAIATQAIANAIAAGRPGQVVTFDYAIMHLAIFDAVEAYDKRFHPYHVVVSNATGSPAAAVAKAAHDTLVALFPTQAASIDSAYSAFLAANNLAANDPGVLVGQQTAAGILNLRANDGRFAVLPPFNGPPNPKAGDWRPTPSFNLPPGAPAGTPPGPPPSFAPMAVEWLATVLPFTLTSPTQFRAPGQPALTSREYTRAFNEVKAFGSLTSSVRSADQTDLGYFFADNFIFLWNRTLRSVAAAHLNRVGDIARLFALAYIVEADAGITVWDSKRHFVFWRPITAVREGDNDGNPRTAGDPGWKPLINTPNYPDYTSGANGVTGAVTKMLALLFRTDKMTFTVTSAYPLAVQKTRTYNRFSDAAQDVVDVRVLQGIHFRFADADARRQGRLVAKWAFKHFLRPINDDDRDEGDDNDDDSDR